MGHWGLLKKNNKKKKNRWIDIQVIELRIQLFESVRAKFGFLLQKHIIWHKWRQLWTLCPFWAFWIMKRKKSQHLYVFNYLDGNIIVSMNGTSQTKQMLKDQLKSLIVKIFKMNDLLFMKKSFFLYFTSLQNILDTVCMSCACGTHMYPVSVYTVQLNMSPVWCNVDLSGLLIQRGLRLRLLSNQCADIGGVCNDELLITVYNLK